MFLPRYVDMFTDKSVQVQKLLSASENLLYKPNHTHKHSCTAFQSFEHLLHISNTAFDRHLSKTECGGIHSNETKTMHNLLCSS